jgi:hypothetical protein
MKNLFLTILLLPTLLFGQDLRLDHSVIQTAPYSVGDTITIKFNTVDVNSTNPTLIQFDYQFNNKLLQKVGHTFKVNQNGTNTSAQTALNSWTGYTFNPDSNVGQSLLSAQYSSLLAGTATYSGNSDWTVERITIQDGIAIEHLDTLIEIRFIVKDRQGTTFSDYSEATLLNWMRATDQSSNTSLVGNSLTQNIDLGNVGGVNAGNVTINLNTPASTQYATQFGYTIYDASTLVNGFPDINSSPIASGNFDANGQVILSTLTNDIQYYIDVYVSSTGFDQSTNQPTYGAWLDDVVTVTDAYLLFQKALSADVTPNNASADPFSYRIQQVLGEITNDQVINFDDSFVSLAHINGVTHNGYITSSTMVFNVSGITSSFGDWNSTPFLKTFTPTDSNKTFNISHALRGDVDFSHSYTPSVAGYVNSAKGQGIRVSKSVNAMKTPENANLDIVSSLVDGKVVVEISTQKAGLVGTQFNIFFDENILTLDTIKYDTGNEMTNFGNVKGNKVSFGSLDYSGEKTVKIGTPYKLVFTPKQSITNTAGLINFQITEGVKEDGTKVKFNIQ